MNCRALQICKAHAIDGLVDCQQKAERQGILPRLQSLGIDRHGRQYWFLVRRIFVVGVDETHYYSLPCHLRQLIEQLDADDLERRLCVRLSMLMNAIVTQVRCKYYIDIIIECFRCASQNA